MKNKNLVPVAGILLLEIILVIIGFLILPDTLVMQITASGGAGNTMPKIVGLAIPFLLCAIFAVLYYFNTNKKHLLIAGLGVVLTVITLVFNLI